MAFLYKKSSLSFFCVSSHFLSTAFTIILTIYISISHSNLLLSATVFGLTNRGIQTMYSTKENVTGIRAINDTL